MAGTAAQFDTCQRTISAMQGIGVRGSFPSKRTVTETKSQSIRQPLSDGDVINSVHFDPMQQDDFGGTLAYAENVSENLVEKLGVCWRFLLLQVRYV